MKKEQRVLNWLSIKEDQPELLKRYYVACEDHNPITDKITQFQTMAEYIPYMTVLEADYMIEDYWGDGDYNQEEDRYYTPEGFYEFVRWNAEYINPRITSKVTHFMPLLELPKLSTEGKVTS